MTRKRGVGCFLAAGWAAALWLGGPLPAGPAKRAWVQWGQGEVTARVITFKQLKGKMVLTFAGPVRAAQPDLELRHADNATAELDAARQLQSLTATGNVGFWARQVSGDQVQEVTGKCQRIVVYNVSGKKPVGEQRFLVADLTGDVRLEVLQKPRAPAAKPAPGAGQPPAPQPIILEGARAQVWLTAQGLEGSLGEE